MNNDDVYCVEDYYLDESNKKLHLILFNTSAFYRDIARRMQTDHDDILRRSANRYDENYEEAMLAVNVHELFEEEVLDAHAAHMRLFGSRPVQYVTKAELEGNVLNARNSGREIHQLTIKKSLNDSRFYRSQLNSPSENRFPRNILSGFVAKYAAIVNVGCGNCCFVFDENNVLVIDCSNRDKGGGQFQDNVKAAIDWVQSIQKKCFHIDCFLLTHPHYDHYSAVCDFVVSQYIDKNTLCYINMAYKCSVGAYTQMLVSLKKLGTYTEDPIAGKVAGPLSILHPNVSPTRCRKVNNASIISEVITEHHNIIFPGDIENSITNEGWNIVPKKAMKTVANSSYYVLSHHGSHNGYGTKLNNPLFSFCSTRPNVYNGIPDPATLSVFQNLMRTDVIIPSSQKPCQYIGVDLEGETATYV